MYPRQLFKFFVSSRPVRLLPVLMASLMGITAMTARAQEKTPVKVIYKEIDTTQLVLHIFLS